MKIGIVTYHRAHNYGAILQAIATRIVLQNMGQDVSYIDYWPKYHKEAYKFFSWKRFRKSPFVYLKGRITLGIPIWNRIKHFENDINEYITPYCKPYCLDEPPYDCVIYGSDQIWRRQIATKRLNPVYFGQNEISAIKHITYAASMGKMIDTPKEKAQIAQWIKKFEAISVREMELQTLVEGFDRNVKLVLDPTLLLSSDQWDSIIHPRPIKKTGYVLYYSLNAGAFDINAIKKFADSKGLRVVEIKGVAGYDSDSVISQCGPRDFVSLIKHADYVFTTSYHGLLFSIIYHKEFYTSFVTNAGRAKSILKIIKQSNRLVQPCTKEIPIFPKIKYEDVDESIEPMRIQSINFLKNAIV